MKDAEAAKHCSDTRQLAKYAGYAESSSLMIAESDLQGCWIRVPGLLAPRSMPSPSDPTWIVRRRWRSGPR
eukprot:3662726-Rhodomonas_salina.1